MSVTTADPRPARRHWLPSIPATVFVAILAFVIFGFQEPLLNSDSDLPRHLRLGEWMLQHHALIRIDPFSFSKPGQPFVACEYGSQRASATSTFIRSSIAPSLPRPAVRR